jgi:hypothetical protein
MKLKNSLVNFYFLQAAHGTLIPSDLLHNFNVTDDDIESTLFADDILLNLCAVKHKLKIVNLNTFMYTEEHDSIFTTSALSLQNTRRTCRNDKYIHDTKLDKLYETL